MQKSMLLVNGAWETANKTFKLIPLTPESPFNEGIYDPDARILVMISKQTKQALHMVAKLDDLGDTKKLKVRRIDGKDYAEERKLLETYYEYYIDNPDDIRELINTVAINAGRFDYAKYMTHPEPAPTSVNSAKVISL